LEVEQAPVVADYLRKRDRLLHECGVGGAGGLGAGAFLVGLEIPMLISTNLKPLRNVSTMLIVSSFL
jgi:hypothetical protein